MGIEEILSGWEAHIDGLFEDDRRERQKFNKKVEGRPILRD